MEGLPDELLLMILSHVHDAAFLLDSASLVCKRWRALCREPAAWASVDLRLTPQDVRKARLLLHAPALRSLSLDELSPLMVAALRRSNAVVLHSLSLFAGGWYESIARAFLDLLGRSCGLRHLAWEVVKLDEHFMEADSTGRPAGAVLASLTRLRSLSLRLGGCHDVAYARELAAGVPSLQELNVSTSKARHLMPCCDPRYRPYIDHIQVLQGPAVPPALDHMGLPILPAHMVPGLEAAINNLAPGQAAAANNVVQGAAAAANNLVPDQAAAAVNPVPDQAAGAVNPVPDQAAAANNLMLDQAVAANNLIPDQANPVPDQAAAAAGNQAPGQAAAGGQLVQDQGGDEDQDPHVLILPGPAGQINFEVVVPPHVNVGPRTWPTQNVDSLTRDLISGPGSRLRSLHLDVDLDVDAAGSLLDALAHCPALQTLAIGRLAVTLGPTRAVDVARLQRFLVGELPSSLEFLRLTLSFLYCHLAAWLDPEEDRAESEAAAETLRDTRRALRQSRPNLVFRLVRLEEPEWHAHDMV